MYKRQDLIDNRNVVEEALEIIEPIQKELIPDPDKEDTEDEDS